jgi:hypothetical protein
MSATTTSLLHFVRDMERLNVVPFRYDSRHWPIACNMRQAALAEDAIAVAKLIKATRLERLWQIEERLAASPYRHPKITSWLHQQLVEIGWRA